MHTPSAENLALAVVRYMKGHDILKSVRESGMIDGADLILLRSMSQEIGRVDLFTSPEQAMVDFEELLRIPGERELLKEYIDPAVDLPSLERRSDFVSQMILYRMGMHGSSAAKSIEDVADKVARHGAKSKSRSRRYIQDISAAADRFPQKMAALVILNSISGAETSQQPEKPHEVLDLVFNYLGWGDPFPGKDSEWEWNTFLEEWSHLDMRTALAPSSNIRSDHFLKLCDIEPHPHKGDQHTPSDESVRKRVFRLLLENIHVSELVEASLKGASQEGLDHRQRQLLESRSRDLENQALQAVSSGLALALVEIRDKTRIGRNERADSFSHLEDEFRNRGKKISGLIHLELDTDDLAFLRQFARTAAVVKVDWDHGDLNLDATLAACRDKVAQFVRQKALPLGFSENEFRVEVAKSDPQTQAMALNAALKQGWDMLSLRKEATSLEEVVRHFAAIKPLLAKGYADEVFQQGLENFTERPELREKLTKMAKSVSPETLVDEEGRILLGKQMVPLSSVLATRVAAIARSKPESLKQDVHPDVLEEMSLAAWSTYNEAAAFISDEEVEAFYAPPPVVEEEPAPSHEEAEHAEMMSEPPEPVDEEKRQGWLGWFRR
jgi:hypothetical protein